MYCMLTCCGVVKRSVTVPVILGVDFRWFVLYNTLVFKKLERFDVFLCLKNDPVLTC